MAVNLSPVAGAAAQFFDNSGQVLTGGKLYTYDAGTTTPAVTYTSSNGVTAHPNPIILNAAGRVPDSGEIWLSDGVAYKFVLKDQNDVLIGTYDNLVGINSNFVNFTGEEEQQTATQGQTVFTLTTLNYQPASNNLLVFVNGSKQISGVNYQETSSTVITFVDGLNVGDVVDFCTATPINTSVVTAAQVSYNQGGTGAVNTTVEAKLQQTISIKDFGAVGDGATDNSDAIQAAIDYLSVNDGGMLYIPTGTYFHSETLIWKNNIVVVGDGKRSSVLMYTGVSDGNQINNPINASTAANIHFQDLSFQSNAGQFAGKCNFVDTGSTYLSFERCLFYGQMISLAFDQTEIARVKDCEILVGSDVASKGLWLINGTARTVGVIQGYTNQIKIEGCQFNGGALGILICDDGGIDHQYIANNYNAGSIQIRATSVYGMSVIGGEFEGFSSVAIAYTNTLSTGAAKWAYGNTTLNITGGYYQSLANLWLFIETNCLTYLNLIGNVVRSTVTPFSGVNNVQLFNSVGNTQIGTTPPEVSINTYFDNTSYNSTFVSANSDASIGNGTLVTSFSRKGKEVTVKGLFTLGSTTVQGTGSWKFGLPVVADTTVPSAGSAVSVVSSNFYNYTATVDNSSQLILTPNGLGSAVQSTVPNTWITTNYIIFSITYTALNTVG